LIEMVRTRIENIRPAVLNALREGRPAEADRLLARAAQDAKGCTDFWRLRIKVALALRSTGDIDATLAQLLSEGPPDARLQLEAGMLALQLGRLNLAGRAAESAKSNVDPCDASLLDAIGTLFVRVGLAAKGVELFRRAVALSSENAAFQYNLAAGERMMGDASAAEAALAKVLAVQPDHAAAHYMRSGLRTQSADSNHVAILQAALARTATNPKQQSALLFALAKELEDLGDHARSFASLREGCRLRRRLMSYDVESDVLAIDNIIRHFDKDSLTSAVGANGSSQAVFVVGLPRSGTTLVERMLNAHSAITGIGESPTFPSAAIEGVQRAAGHHVDKNAFAVFSLKVDPAWLGERYLAEANPCVSRYFVDKLPLNYLYLGLIRRALPQAKVIVVDREPLDACYAMYKTLFEDAYPFTYDLGELARYYAAYGRLIRHWTGLFGPELHRLNYETLVANPALELGRLLDFLDLPWEDDCLDFHRREGVVSTASAIQVRQPLHTRSVGNWRHYTNELQSLIAALRAEGVPV
jgi:tetratricopeptide (TPR) repeat protein